MLVVGILGGVLSVPGSAAALFLEEGGGRFTTERDTTAPIVRSVHIQGNRHFSEGTLKKQIRTRRNRRILGIPGFTWWRWVYRFGNADWMWSRLGEALKSGGEPPAYLDSTTVAGDVRRLQLYYEQQGFFDAEVTSTIRPHPSGNRVRVVFRVEPGSATYVRRVQYRGLNALAPRQRRRLGRETALKKTNWTAETPLSFRVQDQRYRRPVLLEERRRMLSYLRNEGYAAVNRDSIQAIVDSARAPPGSLDVTFQVNPGEQYRFGNVHFRITGPEGASLRRDTLAVPVDTTGGKRPLVTSHIENEGQLGTGLLRRSMQFVPGTTYDRSTVVATKQRLEGAGLFAFTSLTPQFDEAATVDSVRYLPLRIEAQTRQRHRLRMETFGLQRGRQSNFGSIGVGVGGVYENINALGGGETFRLRASGSVASSRDATFFTSTQFEGTASLTLPYLIRPFGQFERIFDLTNARTQISLSALTARRNRLRLRIRSRNSGRLRLEMDHTPTRTSLVDVLDLSVSNPDTLSGFREQFLDPLTEGIDRVQRAQILEDYTQPQINTAFRYTFRSATANPLRRKRGHIYEVSGEVGNSLPLLFDRFIFAPDTLEYSVPGLTGRTGGELSGNLQYRPYVRGTVDLRRYFFLSQESTLAVKLFGGMAHPTGEPTLVPFDRRFFSGGGSSVRGWRLRELGPGNTAADSDTSGTEQGDVTSLLGGDIKLEASVELRTTLLRNILAADWVGATFLDVGNVWFGPRNRGFSRDSLENSGGEAPRSASRNRSGRFQGVGTLTEMGIGGGVGLRIEWEYLIVRLDLAYRLLDPSPSNRDVFSDGPGGPLLHFGIGHAF